VILTRGQAGAGLATLGLRRWRKLAGLCIGVPPVFSMALHDWAYGHFFVLFSAKAGNADLLVMPPGVYAAAARELATFHFAGAHVSRAVAQLVDWLSGLAQSYATIPLNLAGVAILVSVLADSRLDLWLQLIAAAALAQHGVALSYDATIARYHCLAWLLTALVALVRAREIGISWLQKRYPDQWGRIVTHPWSRRLASGLAHLQKMST
jgi:hypothetical protein